MSPLVRHFFWMAANNAWANHRLLRACAALDDDAFRAPRTSFFPSISATLNHQLTVDWYYVDAVERAVAGRPANPDGARFFEPEHPFDRCEPLAAAQRAVDARLVAACRGLPDDLDTLDVPVWRRQGEVHEAAPRLLAHLFQHQIHHRGQVHAMLAGTAVAPPQLDEFFCAGEAHLREAELRELGLLDALLAAGF
jgi:uncharacterized damage-inducible protein DinB